MSKKMKYIVGCYIYGCVVSLFLSGVPNWTYLIPIKLFGIILGVGLGNGLYDTKELKIPFIESVFKSLRFAILYGITVIIAYEIKEALLSNGIDISFFTAPL